MNNFTIYFENKSIAFIDQTTEIPLSENELTVISCSSSIPEIRKQITWFLQEDNATRLIFYPTNFTLAQRNFFKIYKCINAAGGCITSDKGALFIFRNNKWDLPKGKIDKGESIRDAAIRECEEECAVTGLKIKRQLPETYHFYKLKGELVVKRTYWFEMSTSAEQKLKPQKEEGITQIKWFKKNNLSKPLKNTFPSIVDVLRNVKWHQ